jgi:DNA-nicking Smr family endonuclease
MSKTVSKNMSPDDLALFRSAVADATPVRASVKAVQHKPRPAPIPTQLRRDEQQVLKEALADPNHWPDDAEPGEALSFLRPGLPRNILRRLRSGHWIVQEEMDLHGLRTDEAKSHLITFLNDSKKRGLRCVRVIHGKGLRSKNREPVLKHKVRHWLTQRDEILAFIEARPIFGGGGAVIVLLKAAGRITPSHA